MMAVAVAVPVSVAVGVTVAVAIPVPVAVLEVAVLAQPAAAVVAERARRWFLSPQDGQWSHSFRDGMARNRPSLPSISLTSRMTKVLSNVRSRRP